MADPEARVVITGRDATAAAFASAEKHLSRFARSAMQFRSVFAGLGVIVSGRMFANWIKDAIEVEKLTADQAKSIGAARFAMASLNVEFQNLARTAATELAPALEKSAKFWREFLFPTQGEAAAERVREIQDEITKLARTIFYLEGTGSGSETASKRAASFRLEVERLRKEMEALQGVRDKPGNPLDGLHEMTSGLAHMPADLKHFDFAAASASVLNSELQEVSGTLVKMPDDLKRLSPEFNSFAAALRDSGDEMDDMQKQAKEFAQSLGHGFKDAFVDVFMGVDVSFGDLLKRMAAELVTSALFKSLATMFGSKTGPAAGFFANFFGGARAGGGPVSAGKGYIVGEYGPEWFEPGQSGTIVPSMAGGPVIHQHFYNQVGLPPQWAAQNVMVGRMAAAAAYKATSNRLSGRR